MDFEPITRDSPGLSGLFGPLAAEQEAHFHTSLIQMGLLIETMAQRLNGGSSGRWSEFGLCSDSSGRQSIGGRFRSSARGEGEVFCAVELLPGMANSSKGGIPRWDAYVNIDVSIPPPDGDGVPRPVFNQHFPAVSPDDALAKFGDAVRNLDQRMMLPVDQWIAKGRIAGA
jgi:hypothetical protein